MGAEKRAEEVIAYLEKSRKDLRARTAKDAGDQSGRLCGGIGFKGTQGIESTDADYVPFEWTGAKNGSRSLGGREHFFADRERLLSLNPDVIFLDAAGLPLVLQDYGKKHDYYRALKAFKTDRVYVLYPFNFYTTNIECVLADAYAVGKILYPRTFSDIDPGRRPTRYSASSWGPGERSNGEGFRGTRQTAGAPYAIRRSLERGGQRHRDDVVFVAVSAYFAGFRENSLYKTFAIMGLA